jgi:hypothetical protein
LIGSSSDHLGRAKRRQQAPTEAARLLSELGGPWSKATPSQRGKIAQSLFAEIDVRDDRIVGARLAWPGCLPLIASATYRARSGWRARRDPDTHLPKPGGSGGGQLGMRSLRAQAAAIKWNAITRSR